MSARRDDASRGTGGTGAGTDAHLVGLRSVEGVVAGGPDRARPRRRADEFQPYARSKVTPVPVRTDTLHRERLLDWLDANLHKRVTLLIADAGYGKTTLLADYSAQHPSQCLWYRLDDTDRDTTTFLTYLVAAVRELLPEFGVRTAALLAELDVLDPSRDLLVRTFFADLEGLTDVPTVLILDDFHLVDTSSEIQQLMTRLLKDAPPALHFVIATRRRPRIPLARMAARGEVAELDKAAMRFTGEETGRLFAEAYGRPLQPDVLDEVDRRTEGWAASLQLLHSSVRGRTDAEVRQFVSSISGAEGALYDFLAEELLADLDAEMAPFLVYASALDRVLPHHVAAALSHGRVITAEEATETIAAATTAGLLMPVSATEGGHRFHPLLREFLERQLRQTLPAAARRDLHRRVADACLPDEWLPRTEHLVKAGDIAEAQATLGNAAAEVVATGLVARVGSLLREVSPTHASAQLTLLLARRQLELKDLNRASTLLSLISDGDLNPASRALYFQTLSTIAWDKGNPAAATEYAVRVRDDPTAPTRYREMADAFLLACDPNTRVHCLTLAAKFSQLAQSFVQEGLHHHAAIAYHDAATAELIAANYTHASKLARQALAEFASAGATPADVNDTRAIVEYSEAHAEGSDRADALLALRDDPVISADVYALAGHLHVSRGSIDAALDHLRLSAVRAASSGASVDTAANIQYLATLLRLAAPHATIPRANVPYASAGIGWQSVVLIAQAIGDLHGEGARLAYEARAIAEERGWQHWSHRASLVAAVAAQDAPAFARSLAPPNASKLLLAELADVVAIGLNLLSEPSPAVRESQAAYPNRWLPALRRAIASESRAVALAAAHELDAVGVRDDVPMLRAFAKREAKWKRTDLGRRLLQRTSPRLRVQDLGSTLLWVADKPNPLASFRPKSAALLLFLVTRPQHSVPRDQLLEALWPEADPDSGLNNLNQALYYLRRDIDPWYEDGISPNYVHLRRDLVWLDASLVESDSARFQAAATQWLADDGPTGAGAPLIAQYRGRFAPEFEYEEWSEAWRTTVHSSFFAVGRRVCKKLVLEGRLSQAAGIAQSVLRVDPGALHAEADLIWLYSRLGIESAAAEQYAHYASAYEAFYGEPPTPLEALRQAAFGSEPV